MASALFMFIAMMAQRGHPKNWRLGQGWVEFWGGDYYAMQEEIQMERIQRALYQQMQAVDPALTEQLNAEAGETISLDSEEEISAEECSGGDQCVNLDAQTS